MASGSLDDIRAYCRQMVRCLERPAGGFIPKWYLDSTIPCRRLSDNKT
jgi:hypothetical protein